MRMIDADELLNGLYNDRPKDVFGYIAEQPNIDAVKVVRCKDCKYFDKYIDCKEMYQWDGFCADWARKTYENWYCSRGEKEKR